jgi:pimeloyl-ACP methyl ester carboxylesterase
VSVLHSDIGPCRSRSDLPATINYILKATGQTQLYYIGHSQGTEIGFAEFGRNPEVAAKVKLFVALAPVAQFGHVKGAMKKLAPFANDIEVGEEGEGPPYDMRYEGGWKRRF